MNKEQITKQYSTVFICLALASMLILFATPFVKAFKLDIGLISGSESGLDYLTNMFDMGKNNNDNNSSDDDWFDEDTYSDYTIIDEGSEKGIMFMLVLILLFGGAICFIIVLTGFANKNPANAINQALAAVKMGFGFNIAYYVFCMYIIFKCHDWDLESILTGDAIVTTDTYIPMFLQIIVFIFTMLLYKNWVNAMAGNGEPINFGFGGSSQSTQTSHTGQQNYQAGSSSQGTRNEIENLDLLKKYKELFDSGIITAEEFNIKKKELLGNCHNSQQNRSNGWSAESSKYQTSSNQKNQQTSERKKVSDYGMKWYKFLIYFSLFAGAALNAIFAIIYFTGAIYDGSADLVYEIYPDLRGADILCGLAFISLAIMSLITRSALYWYKKSGPKLLRGLYIANAVVAVSYMAIASLITEEMLFDGTTIIATLSSSLVMIIVNNIYFKKRKDIFTC